MDKILVYVDARENGKVLAEIPGFLSCKGKTESDALTSLRKASNATGVWDEKFLSLDEQYGQFSKDDRFKKMFCGDALAWRLTWTATLQK